MTRTLRMSRQLPKHSMFYTSNTFPSFTRYTLQR